MKAHVIVFTYYSEGIPLEGKAVEFGSRKGAIIRDPVTGEEMFLSFEEAMKLIETGRAQVVKEMEVEGDSEIIAIVENSNVSFDDILSEMESGDELAEALQNRTPIRREERNKNTGRMGIMKILLKRPKKGRKRDG